MRGIRVIILVLAFFVGTGIIGFMMFDQLNTVFASSETPYPKPGINQDPVPWGHTYTYTYNYVGASGPGTRVLVLVDANTQGTTDLVEALVTAGNTVTRRAVPEFTWDGTNPSLDNFDVVIHLNGAWFQFPLPVSGQTALVDFVKNGGGFINGQWNGFELVKGQQTSMNDLILQLWDTGGDDNCRFCFITYSVVAGQESHPVLAGIPSPFTFRADGHDASSLVIFGTDPSTVLMTATSGGPGVTVREFENGRVVSFSHAANFFSFGRTLQDSNIQQLYVNAVDWTCDCSDTTPPEAALLVEIVPEERGKHGVDGAVFRFLNVIVTDDKDPNPIVIGDVTLNGVVVQPGDLLRLELDDEFEVEQEEGDEFALRMEAPTFIFSVTASDASGNEVTVEVAILIEDFAGADLDVDEVVPGTENQRGTPIDEDAQEEFDDNVEDLVDDEFVNPPGIPSAIVT